MVNVTGCYKDTECDNITAHPAVHYTLLSLQASFIPVIVFASIFVIAAVRLVKKLNTPHNKILELVSWMDLLIGIIVIPANLLRNIPATQHHFQCNNHIAHHNEMLLLLKSLTMFIQIMSLLFLTMLTIDTFLQINYPIAYMKYITVKRIHVFTVIIVLVYVLEQVTVFATGTDALTVEDLEHIDGFMRRYNFYYAISCLVICLFCSVEVRVMRWKYSKGEIKGFKKDVTNLLLMVFIVFYMPTIIYKFIDLQRHKDQGHDRDHVIDEHNFINLIRYAVPLTNGLLIYRSRQVYKTAFHFFMSTNPLRWNGLQHHINARKSTWAGDYMASPKDGRPSRRPTSLSSSSDTISHVFEDVTSNAPNDDTHSVRSFDNKISVSEQARINANKNRITNQSIGTILKAKHKFSMAKHHNTPLITIKWDEIGFSNPNSVKASSRSINKSLSKNSNQESSRSLFTKISSVFM